MASSQDTEITLGTGKLLVLFFGLVAVCALFFALGYSLGRKSEPAITMANAAALPQTTPGSTKPAGAASVQPPMTFYKAVEQKQASPELTSPLSDAKTESTPRTAAPAGHRRRQVRPMPRRFPSALISCRLPRLANRRTPEPWSMP